MRVLAIDTALEACSAALLDTDLAAVVASETRVMVRGHAEALMPLVADVMRKARLNFRQLDRVAVTVGPGSFTGLRVGIAAARGIGLTAMKPVVGLTTLASLAAPYVAADDTMPVAAVIDARHSHVYLQIFGAGARTLVPARLAKLDEAVWAASVAGARLVGSGADAIAAAWPEPKGPPLVDKRRAPDIDWVARLGAAAIISRSAPKPFYLRAPDAQPQKAGQLSRR